MDTTLALAFIVKKRKGNSSTVNCKNLNGKWRAIFSASPEALKVASDSTTVDNDGIDDEASSKEQQQVVGRYLPLESYQTWNVSNNNNDAGSLGSFANEIVLLNGSIQISFQGMYIVERGYVQTLDFQNVVINNGLVSLNMAEGSFVQIPGIVKESQIR